MRFFDNARDISESPQTPIQECFAGAGVLVTGGTGFLGKYLIEKLLWSCPDIKKIYMLIRSKKNKNPAERFEEIFNSKFFERVGKVKPNFRECVSIICGDATQADLGISEEDRNIIISEVNIVFHSAATVRFDEKLRLASNINIQGTINMIELCKQIDNLKAVIHVSTTYSHCYKRTIDEQLYDCGQDPLEFLEFVHKISDEELHKLTPKILGEWPNTYCFTKALAEEMVRRCSKDLPIVLYRPSIVFGSWREPFVGSLDSMNGPMGLMMGIQHGIIRFMNCNFNCIADFIPVDMVCNGMIAAAWDKSSQKEKDCTIFNCVTGSRNPIKIGQFVNTAMILGQVIPFPEAIWCSVLFVTTSKVLAAFYNIILHYIPGACIDFVLKIKGDKPIMLKMYKKLTPAASLMSFFLLNEWKFGDTNTQTLLKKMTERDRVIFPFDVQLINWYDYIYDSCWELRRSLCNAPDSSIPYSRKKIIRFKHIQNTILAVFWVLITYYLYRIFL